MSGTPKGAELVRDAVGLGRRDLRATCDSLAVLVDRLRTLYQQERDTRTILEMKYVAALRQIQRLKGGGKKS